MIKVHKFSQFVHLLSEHLCVIQAFKAEWEMKTIGMEHTKDVKVNWATANTQNLSHPIPLLRAK